ncbi:O-methyltransferase [Dyella sedimenti]|uniref:O-methyltransferase n=1 Tax=Dyella sedimenti TaxID=2919947 RepID=UPI001FAA1F39|nr:O-methyltransferase [Dyella sedimenti]
MSGSDIPYQLRPSKFIDRQIFVELLGRLIQSRGPEAYIYISMGGRHLVDHYAVYKDLGIKAQFSFDNDKNQVARQAFNRPTDTTVCATMDSADLPSKLDEIAGKFPSKRNFIIWLDYTGTDHKAQLQEAEEVLVRLRHGDVFRITMNANLKCLKEGSSGNPAERAKKRADTLRSRLGGANVPTSVTVIDDDPLSLARVLAQCVALMASKAKLREPSLNFVPVLTTSYADGQRMLTMTCVVSEQGHAEIFPNANFKRWAFARRTWDDIQDISVPVLSAKERFRLDANLKKSGKKMLTALRFLPAENEEQSLLELASYKKFQRFYPAFRHVDD